MPRARVGSMAVQKPTPRKKPARTQVTYNRTDPNHQVVDPRWLGKVLALTIGAAFVCSYLAMCLLYGMGSWELVLHPTHKAGGTGLSSEAVRFGPAVEGKPGLVGEFVPAAAQSGASALQEYTTVLYLRTGDGQLDFADAPLITSLHELGMNVLAFDYRGYGRSGPRPHPSEKTMNEDADSAWAYLRGTRGVSAQHLVIYGAGVGGSVAAELAKKHPEAAALIVRNVNADVLGTVLREPRSRFFPVRLLFHDRFPVGALDEVKLPKLLLDVGPEDDAAKGGGPEERARVAAYRAAADPKMVVTLPGEDPAKERESMKRFLDDRATLLPAPVLTQQLPPSK